MITMCFSLLMIAVFGRLFLIALRATWGIIKVFGIFLILPAVLIGLVVAGLIKIALPILAIVGLVSIFNSPKTSE